MKASEARQNVRRFRDREGLKKVFTRIEWASERAEFGYTVEEDRGPPDPAREMRRLDHYKVIWGK